MSTLKYFVLDVFTDQRYKGNQLSVVYTDHELDINQYHDISQEFGYSETSFISYSTDENVLKVRSFTPAKFEVIGAGHNLLGAVFLAIHKEWDIFKNQDGQPWVMISGAKIPLQINVQNNLCYVGMKQSSAKIVGQVPADIIAEAIGLSINDLDSDQWEVNIVKNEVAHLMVPVNNLEALQKAVSNKSLLKEASLKFGFEGCYLFTVIGTDAPYLAETRFFNPSIGIDEDPATGTAAGPLAGYLAQSGYIRKHQDFQILQGKYIDQLSIIHVKVVDDGIWVSGTAVLVMEGELYL